MPIPRIVTPLLAGLLLGSALLSSAARAQAESAIPNLFTSEDFRADREHWTDPAYYLGNTARQITDMQVDVRYGEAGEGDNALDIKSPYEFTTAGDHYAAWLAEAGGRQEPTEADRAKFDGFWGGGGGWLGSNIQASSIVAALTDEYKEYYVQQLLAEAQGRHWWPASFCLPEGLLRAWPFQVMSFRPGLMTMTTNVSQASAAIRWIDMTGEFSPPEMQYERWFGESIGAWTGDSLIIHTNQLRNTNSGHSMTEWSNQAETVERFTPQEDGTIAAEITIYDPLVLLNPVHVSSTLERDDDAEYYPVFSTCSDTQGPSRNVWVDEAGVLQERNVNDPMWWDYTDRRPWAAHYAIGEGSDGWREQRFNGAQ